VNQFKKSFNKPATTYFEQLEQLKSRGMIITEPEASLRALEQFNYYRLSAYWQPFEMLGITHQFKPNTTFEDVLILYCFDKQLRLLLLDSVERIEISVRSKWAYVLAHSHGVYAHLESGLAKDFWSWHCNLKKLQEALISSKKDSFIKHFKDNYQEPSPPIWVVCEVMTLGLLSKYYDNLKPKETRRMIATAYGLDDDCFASWLQHLTVVRNMCAHHARLWNREFVKTPQHSITKPAILSGTFTASRKIYNTLLIVLYLMDVIEPENEWRTALLALLHQHPTLLPRMGFPTDWASHAIWSKPHAEQPI
jgi:abortive infection bacteriophage resistance protein